MLREAVGRLSADAQAQREVSVVLHEFRSGRLDGIPDGMTSAFNELIQREKYGVFVELFRAYYAVLEEGAANDRCPEMDAWIEAEIQYHGDSAGDGSSPIRTQLRLHLPGDWAPCHDAAMEAAFSQVRVDCLTVLGPSFPRRGGQVAAGVSTCVKAFLRGGTTALVVSAPLMDVESVSAAIPGSRLTSIELRFSSMGQADLAQGLLSYKTLTQAAGRCHALTHLGVRHPVLVALAETRTAIEALGRHGLASVALRCHDVNVLEPLMQALRQCPSLSKIELESNINSAAAFRSVIAGPLQGHGALRSLRILPVQPGPSFEANADNLLAIVDVAEFLATFTKMQDFSWGVLYGPNPVYYLNVLRGLDLSSAVERLTGALQRSISPLRSLVMEGFPFPVQLLKAFFQCLARLAWLRHLGLARSILDLASSLDVWDLLGSSLSRLKVTFPKVYDSYYFTSADGAAYGPPWDLKGHEAFELAISLSMPEPQRAEVASQFHRLRDRVDAFFWAIARMEDVKTAQNDLLPGIAGFMNAAYVANTHEPWKRDDPEQFVEGASRVFDALAKEARVVSALQAAGVVSPGAPARSRTHLEALEKIDRRRVHAGLMKDVENDHVDAVRLRLARGETDVGGRGRKAAKTKAMQAVFAASDPKMDRFTYKTPTTTTTTTTSATTTTTTTSVTGSVPRARATQTTTTNPAATTPTSRSPRDFDPRRD